MKIEKFFIFLILIAFLVSVGGVSAQDINNTASDEVVGVDAVLTDTLYAEEENNEDLESVNTTTTNIEVLGDNSLESNFSCDIDEGIESLTVNFKDNSTGKPTSWLWDFGDGNTSTEQNPAHAYAQWGSYNVSLNVSDGDVSSCMVKQGFINVYQLNSQLINLDFEESGTLVGWDYKKASITTNFRNAKNGIRYASLQNNGSISKFINLDIIDSLSFWYMSSNKNATINVLIDDECVTVYTIKKTGIGKWEQVFINLTNYTGYHTLKFYQNVSSAYIDNINVDYNSILVANFTPVSFNITPEGLVVSFCDESSGLISNWLWDFGDGTYSTEQNPTHNFKLGNQTVKLTISNKYGSEEYSYSWNATAPYVESTGLEYGFIQEAIDNADEGDTITITSCEYYDRFFENLVIDKSLTLNFNNCTLTGNDSVPIINVVNGANVIINNISFDSNINITTDKASKITLENSQINDINITVNGNVFVNNNSFSNGFLIIESNAVVEYCNLTHYGIIVNDGKSKIINNVLVDCDVAISQTGGELNLTGNTMTENNIAVNISGGKSNINFNEIYSNKDFGLVYSTEGIDYSNNWWGSNNPTFNSSLTTPDEYYDIYQVSDNNLISPSYLVLNVSNHDLDYHYWVGGVTYYNLTIDLAHNNLGEDVSSSGSLPSKNYNFKFNNIPFDVYMEDGFREYLFTWGYLTGDIGEMSIEFENQLLTLPLKVDCIAPNITYITPSATFKDNVEVKVDCDDSSAVIFYTLDGTNPCNSLTRLVYTEPFCINESSCIHVTAIDFNGNYAINNYTWIGISSVPTIFSYEAHYVDYVITLLKESDFVDLNYIWGKYQDNNGVTIYNGSLTNLTSWSNLNIVSSGSAVIDNDGFIYIAAEDGYLYCLNSQGLIIWRYGTTSSIICTPVIGEDGNIYFNNWMNSTLYCISPEGKLIWKYWLGDYNDGSNPVFGLDGTLYILTGNEKYSNLYAFKNQELLWNTTLPVISGSTPAVADDGSIYLISADHELICINWDGTIKYSFSLIATHLQAYSKISVDLKETRVSVTVGENNTIYVINQPHYFIFNNPKYVPESWYSIRAYSNDGNLKWCSLLYDDFSSRVKTTYVLFGAPTYYNGILYLNDQYSVIALNASTGDVLWKHVHGEGYVSVLNDKLIIDSSVTYKEFSGEGKSYWILPEMTNAEMNLIPAAGSNYNQVIFPPGTYGYYNVSLGGIASNYTQVVFSPEDYGVYNNSLAVNDSIDYSEFAPVFTSSSPLISGNGVIYITKGNMVYALTIDGEELWSYNISGLYGGALSLSGPVLTDDGTLIVTTTQGIYAFRDIAAEFAYKHVDGSELTVQFSDLSTKGNNSYFWSFGDGCNSTEQNPEHTYAEAGKYRVELYVTHNGINLARNTTIEVVFHDIVSPDSVTAYINNSNVTGGIFNTTQTVSLNSSDDSRRFTIYYTVDGSNPVNSSNRRVYSEPIDIEVNTVLNAVAVDESGNYGNVSTFNFTIADAINVNEKVNSTLIQKIQELLDNADANSKFVFDYDELWGANFTINKPLNIISNVNTRLIGNGNQPVFTLGENAVNSTINGFNIENNESDGILIQNSNNVKVINSIIQGDNAVNIINSNNTLIKDTLIANSTNGIQIISSDNTNINKVTIVNSTENGVYLKGSNNSVIQNSLLESNGVDPYYSEANHILLDNCENTKIINNTLNYGYFGLYFKNTNKNTLVDNNTIYEGVGDAIYLSGRYIGLNITHNTLDGCFMGINFNGYSEKVEVLNNLIQKMHSHPGEPESGLEYDLFYNFRHSTDLYGQYNNAIQVFELASNFHNEVHIENNVCILLEHRAWESRKTSTYTQSGCDGYGYNLMDGSDSYHWITTGTTHYRTGFVDLVVDRVGDSSYRLRLQNMRTGEFLSEIPAFDVIFTAGRYTQTVKFEGSEAVATFDVASSITTITATISAEIKKSISWSVNITEGFNSFYRQKDPGYEAGEAINNPKPVIPSIQELINGNNPSGHEDNPSVPDVPEENNNITPGTTPGNGTGNGTGHGNGTDGSGSGTGIGNGTGSGVGTGNGTSLNPGNTDSTGNATVSGNSTEVPTNSTETPSNTPDIPSNSTAPTNSTDVPDTPANATDVPANSSDVSDTPANATDVPSSSTEVSEIPANSTVVEVSEPVTQVNVTNMNDGNHEEVIDPENLLNPGDITPSMESEAEVSEKPAQQSSQPQGGEVGASGGSSGSDGSKAYEIKKAIDIENTEISLLALVVFLSAVFFFIVGWGRGGSEDDDEL
ncbi:PKD domain-containing protein [Methanobrevibacter sp.]|uniref:PKD domain-containing protein n=1 Tax=Methanobrevibacter sp. TaxID=66852 RepID=UPI00386C90F0